jgi:membrane fusion protein, multidrug efflux system
MRLYLLLSFLALTVCGLCEETSPHLQPETDKIPITFTVILDPMEKVEVFPEIFEEIETIPFRMGQSFKKGDLLLRMKNQFYASQLEKTIKALEFAEEDLKIKESLHKDKLISTLELLQTELNLATAKSNLDEAARNYQWTIVIAPFDGKIGAIHVREHERPVRQKSMMNIFNDHKIIAKFLIPAYLLPKFHIGQILPIYIRDRHKSFPARLIRLGGEINPVSLKVNVEAEIDNPDGAIIPGMSSFFEFNINN